MHAFFLTRGNKRDVDEFIDFLKTRNLPVPFIDKEGKKGYLPQTGIVQPVQMWSFVFPENWKNEVLTALKFDKENIERWASNKQVSLMRNGLRLALGADKIPELQPVADGKGLYMPVNAMENISIIPIGVKKDVYSWKADGRFYECL